LQDELAETTRLCEEHGARVKTYVVDVTDVEALRAAVKSAETDLGEIE
jgi:NADP-dependent 3-hydroxy acid dehydrogenase YdfG